jgi:hypothetical protein
VVLVAGGRTTSALGIICGVNDGHGQERAFPRFLDRTVEPEMGKGMAGPFSARFGTLVLAAVAIVSLSQNERARR